ncbi:uncharacterized protein LOC113470810 [Diaphorina citri]|uniref:Uncharacterized protein LOC113470810 n=1 Tax=Diaphorina citri TaxID=121845 RepID=A0A3Q0JF72_DIACI|nr:uncharacterized protein LOC113470810 [Diaphorina citri]
MNRTTGLQFGNGILPGYLSDERTIVCTQPVKLTLNPGINVFKLWYNADGHFLVGIFGTGEFQTVSRCKLNLLLSQVSLHVSQLVTDIVTKLSTLLQAGPGTWEHGTAYTAFIEAFCPRKYFDPGTNINERVQIKVDVLQKLESLLMENILSYNFDSVLSTIAAPNSSSTSLTNPLDGVIVQAILQCQEIFQDAVFGERYLELNAPHYHRLLVSFKQTSASQLTVKKGSKLSKLMKSSMSLQQKKTKSKLTAATASKFSILNSLLGDIIERNASEFFTLLAATPGVETADVIQQYRYSGTFDRKVNWKQGNCLEDIPDDGDNSGEHSTDALNSCENEPSISEYSENSGNNDQGDTRESGNSRGDCQYTTEDTMDTDQNDHVGTFEETNNDYQQDNNEYQPSCDRIVDEENNQGYEGWNASMNSMEEQDCGTTEDEGLPRHGRRGGTERITSRRARQNQDDNAEPLLNSED